MANCFSNQSTDICTNKKKNALQDDKSKQTTTDIHSPPLYRTAFEKRMWPSSFEIRTKGNLFVFFSYHITQSQNTLEFIAFLLHRSNTTIFRKENRFSNRTYSRILAGMFLHSTSYYLVCCLNFNEDALQLVYVMLNTENIKIVRWETKSFFSHNSTVLLIINQTISPFVNKSNKLRKGNRFSWKQKLEKFLINLYTNLSCFSNSLLISTEFSFLLTPQSWYNYESYKGFWCTELYLRHPDGK